MQPVASSSSGVEDNYDDGREDHCNPRENGKKDSWMKVGIFVLTTLKTVELQDLPACCLLYLSN
jgi:hypothetical protein